MFWKIYVTEDILRFRPMSYETKDFIYLFCHLTGSDSVWRRVLFKKMRVIQIKFQKRTSNKSVYILRYILGVICSNDGTIKKIVHPEREILVEILGDSNNI